MCLRVEPLREPELGNKLWCLNLMHHGITGISRELLASSSQATPRRWGRQRQECAAQTSPEHTLPSALRGHMVSCSQMAPL